MKKNNQLLLAMLLAWHAVPSAAQSEIPEFQKVEGVNVTSMSSDGKFVVGTKSSYAPEMFTSFLWEPDTNGMDWLTSGEDADTDKGGAFVKVTDQKVIAGIMKDKDLVVEIPGDDMIPSSSFTLTTAAVWKNEKIYKLGIGGNDVSVFIDESDGSYLSGISADGNVISGYLQWGYFPQLSVRWEYDAVSDTYKGLRYTVPENTEISATRALSADGKITVGQAFFDGSNHAMVWTSTNEYRIVDLGLKGEQGMNGTAAAVSPDGHYALICINASSGPKLAVYDIHTDKTEEIALTNAFEVNGYAIDNKGNFFCSITDNINFMQKTYYYHSISKVLIDMNYYMQQFVPGAQDVPDMSIAQPTAMSADGTMVAGNLMENGITVGWWLRAKANAITIPAVTGVKAFTSGIGRITVKWDALTTLTDGITVKEYKLSMDGTEIHTEKADVANQDGVFSYTLEAEAGLHSFSVKAVCNHADGEVMSPESNLATAVMPDSYEIPMTDDFESMSFDANSWETQLLAGNESEVLNWNVSGGDFENNTYFASALQSALKPYKAALLSRFFDASQLDKVYLTFYSKAQFVNMTSENLETEFLDVEYSTDGEQWNPLITIKAADRIISTWDFTTGDFSEQLAGKQFKLRFVARGEGKAMLKWSLDYISIGSELSNEKPEGLKALAMNDKTELIWKSSIGAYELSYIANSNVLTDYNIGNEGKPLIVAISLPKEKIADYVGKYISSVTSFIFDDPAFGSSPTHAEAVIYADNQEVARHAFSDAVATIPYSATVALPLPVKLEAGKEYKIAVRIYDYDSQQSPLYYQAVEDKFIAGVTDLYSEDEGKTWKKISEFNANNEDPRRAWCIWPIRANITDSSTPVGENPELDPSLLAYNVYSDGEQLNKEPVYASYLKFTDTNPKANAKYTVQAFYIDGRVSEMSDAVVAEASSIHSIAGGCEEEPRICQSAEAICILGHFDSAKLLKTDGQIVKTVTDTGTINAETIAPGVYLLIIESQGISYVNKVLIK